MSGEGGKVSDEVDVEVGDRANTALLESGPTPVEEKIQQTEVGEDSNVNSDGNASSGEDASGEEVQGKHTLEIEAAKDGTEKDSNRLSTLFTGNKVYTVITAAGLLILIVSVVLAIVLAPKKTVRTYYISTEDVHWDYTPLSHDACTGKAFSYPANKFTSRRYGNTSAFDNRIGTKYWKARFLGVF